MFKKSVVFLLVLQMHSYKYTLIDDEKNTSLFLTGLILMEFEKCYG